MLYSNHYAQVLPLQVRNSWTYVDANGGRYKITVVDSGFIFREKTYYKIGQPGLRFFGLARYDSNDSIFYFIHIVHTDSTEVPYYKRGISYGDTVHFSFLRLPAMFYLEANFPGLVFDSLVDIKVITYERFGRLTVERSLWTEEFGRLRNWDGITGSLFSRLVGCVINGVVYGDTTVVNVDDYNPEIPNEYKLYQNYPNPLNPITTIRYDLKENSFVKLKVYDILGNEVTTLVNDYQQEGTYSIKLDGSNLSSGIYFYKIVANDFIDIKKFIVIK
jgi:hypothetical protein